MPSSIIRALKNVKRQVDISKKPLGLFPNIMEIVGIRKSKRDRKKISKEAERGKLWRHQTWADSKILLEFDGVS